MPQPQNYNSELNVAL